MARYPKQPLEEKEAWMRERMQRKAEAEERGVSVLPLSETKFEREKLIDQSPHMLRVKEVAAILGVSISTVQRWFRGRAISATGAPPRPGHRVRRTMLISRHALDKWLKDHAA